MSSDDQSVQHNNDRQDSAWNEWDAEYDMLHREKRVSRE